ncbi:MAG: hypothetical protein HQM08_17450 [Candidatus Riflebacteria bacterium]|nr:hypothetical protein [Candidatus Riflebacteria bacterium]
MTWTTFGPHIPGTVLKPEDGDKISNNVKQLAMDIYANPTSNDNGLATLPYPLELGVAYSGSILGNGSTGITVTMPTTLVPATADDYEVFPAWQENPGSNGQIWVEKTVQNFVIKHSGSELGKKIGFQIVRKTIT